MTKRLLTTHSECDATPPETAPPEAPPPEIAPPLRSEAGGGTGPPVAAAEVVGGEGCRQSGAGGVAGPGVAAKAGDGLHGVE